MSVFVLETRSPPQVVEAIDGHALAVILQWWTTSRGHLSRFVYGGEMEYAEVYSAHLERFSNYRLSTHATCRTTTAGRRVADESAL